MKSQFTSDPEKLRSTSLDFILFALVKWRNSEGVTERWARRRSSNWGEEYVRDKGRRVDRIARQRRNWYS